MAKEELIIGTKSNGIVKIGVSKYKFSYRKKQTNYKDFVRTKSIINTGGKQSVKAEYNRWLKSLEEDEIKHFSQSTYANSKVDVRLGTYIEHGGEWEKWAKQNYSRSSFPNMETAIKTIREDKEFCHLYISKITKSDCQTFFKKVYERKKLKENSLIKVKQALSSVFVSREEEINPTLGIGFKDYYKHEVDRQVKKDMILRDDQLKIVLNRVKKTKDKRFITVVYLTLFLCLRRGEVHGLKVSDIKWDENKINIDRTVVQLKEGQTIQNWTKNGETRVVPLFSEIREILKEYLQFREEKGYVKEYDDKGVETSFLFANKTGKLPHLETFSKRFKGIIDELNNEGLLDIQPTFHSLRGSGISYYVMNQHVSLPIVQKFAGHSDIKTTMKYYVKVEDKDVIELSKRNIDRDFL